MGAVVVVGVIVVGVVVVVVVVVALVVALISKNLMRSVSSSAPAVSLL